MTRSIEEYRQILELWESGTNKKAISRITGIPRRTIIDCIQRYGSLETLEVCVVEEMTPILPKILHGEIIGDHARLLQAYAYILGIYLGDGNISLVRKTLRLRVTLDTKYPNIIAKCVNELQILLSDNQIGIVNRERYDRISSVDVTAYYKYWGLLLPQHGEGEKHTRPIVLEKWQQRIVDEYPLEFFRGLYHSDGSRSRNVVDGIDYPRYCFSNCSKDIIDLFCVTCDRLGVHWTTKFAKSRDPKHRDRWDIYVSKRPDVEYLDSVIGAKS